MNHFRPRGTIKCKLLYSYTCKFKVAHKNLGTNLLEVWGIKIRSCKDVWMGYFCSIPCSINSKWQEPILLLMNYQPSNLEDHWIQETMFFWLKFVKITFYYVEGFPCIFYPWNFGTTVISLQPFVWASCGLRAGCHQRCGASSETRERSGTGQSPSGSLEGYSLGWHQTPEVASIYVLTLCMYF